MKHWLHNLYAYLHGINLFISKVTFYTKISRFFHPISIFFSSLTSKLSLILSNKFYSRFQVPLHDISPLFMQIVLFMFCRKSRHTFFQTKICSRCDFPPFAARVEEPFYFHLHAISFAILLFWDLGSISSTFLKQLLRA